MNNFIAKFEKVSYEQFRKDWLEVFKYVPINWEDENKAFQFIYDNIKLPKRATNGSAGYDFFCPINIGIPYDDSITIPTGIRCKINDGWVLTTFPRSGHGFKYGVHLANTVGIIDSDYYNAENEGHILVKLVNDSTLGKNQNFKMEIDTAMFQGIFLPYGVAEEDEVTGVRTGGFGSTDKTIETQEVK